VVITCGVIVLTLLQALVLPVVVRWSRLPVDNSVDQERHLAEVATIDAAYEAIEQTAEHLGSEPPVVDRVRHEIDKRRKLLAADGAGDDPVVLHDDQYTALRLALLGRERATLVQLRDEQQIDDIVLRQVQARLDQEEVRLSRSAPVD
jgi:CPA1 family monovalent cation:H+ antiporter